MSRPAFFSIHDLMPQTIDAVAVALEELQSIPAEHVVLLVVPNCDWNSSHLDTIRGWADDGYQLAGHGWRHVCKVKKNLFHRIHSWTMSRNVAEHLSCSEQEISQIIGDCFQWFEQQQLPTPCWYVPPAWALGRISMDQLSRLPFRFYEVLSGVIDVPQKRFRRMPLMGYEADTLLRSAFLNFFNGINRGISQLSNKPVRVSIHPFDFRYRQARQLRHFIDRCRPDTDSNPLAFHSANPTTWLASLE